MAMAKHSVLVGVFDDTEAALSAVDELRRAGIDDHDLNVLLRGAGVAAGDEITDAVGTKDAAGAIQGIWVGASVGIVLGIIGGFIAHGYGNPTLGVIATMLGAGAAGAAVGGMVGAMMGLGVSEREAIVMEKSFPSGRAIVAVADSAQTGTAQEVIQKHGGRDVHTMSIDGIPSSGKLLRQFLLSRRLRGGRPPATEENVTMKSQTLGLRIAGTVFAIVFVGQLIRLATRADVLLGAYHVPLWASAVVLLVTGGLSVWMWKLSNTGAAAR